MTHHDRRRCTLALSAAALTRTLSTLAVALCAAALTTPGFAAETYPNRPIRVVVPFPAGGGTDVLARVVGEELGRSLGQTVVVENKPGAGTVIGNDAVAKSPGDGYVLLMTTSALTIAPSMIKKLPYRDNGAFRAISMIGYSPNVIVVRADSPFRNLADLIAFAKKKPGGLNYGSSGIGSTVHLAAELLNSMAQISTSHIPYKGGAQQATDLLAGSIDYAVSTMPSIASFVNAGKLRALAVTSEKRTDTWPDVQTVGETVPGYIADVWFGVLAPSGTPEPIAATLSTAIDKAKQSESVRLRAEKEGVILSTVSAADFSRTLKTDEAQWKRVAQQRNITGE